MNRLFAIATLVAVLATASIQSASGFALFSPVLLRVGVAGRNMSTTVDPQISQAEIPSVIADFGSDVDLMRYKHEILDIVYEKSLTRGFGGPSQ